MNVMSGDDETEHVDVTHVEKHVSDVTLTALCWYFDDISTESHVCFTKVNETSINLYCSLMQQHCAH